MSEKQALVDFVTTTRAVPGVSFTSGWERCSNQYHTPPRAAKKTTASAGFTYSVSVIAGSFQTCLADTIGDLGHHCERSEAIQLRSFRGADNGAAPSASR